MQIFQSSRNSSIENPLFQQPLQRRMDADEKIVRKALVKAWIRILEKYARPGALIPPIEIARRELLDVGVDAAVKAIADAHWFVFSFMVREEIQKKVEVGLAKFDLSEFMKEVKVAQNDPQMLAYLRQKIKHYILEEV